MSITRQDFLKADFGDTSYRYTLLLLRQLFREIDLKLTIPSGAKTVDAFLTNFAAPIFKNGKLGDFVFRFFEEKDHAAVNAWLNNQGKNLLYKAYGEAYIESDRNYHTGTLQALYKGPDGSKHDAAHVKYKYFESLGANNPKLHPFYQIGNYIAHKSTPGMPTNQEIGGQITDEVARALLVEATLIAAGKFGGLKSEPEGLRYYNQWAKYKNRIEFDQAFDRNFENTKDSKYPDPLRTNPKTNPTGDHEADRKDDLYDRKGDYKVGGPNGPDSAFFAPKKDPKILLDRDPVKDYLAQDLSAKLKFDYQNQDNKTIPYDFTKILEVMSPNERTEFDKLLRNAQTDAKGNYIISKRTQEHLDCRLAVFLDQNFNPRPK